MQTELGVEGAAPTVTPQERLRDLAHETLADHEGRLDDALAAFTDAVSADPDLLVALIGEDVVSRKAGDYLRLVKASPHGRELGKAALERSPEDRHQDDGKRRLRRELTGLLGSYMVGGKPLGIVTRAELVAAAEVDERNGKFKRALVAKLPSDDAVVGHHVTAKVAQQLWAQQA